MKLLHDQGLPSKELHCIFLALVVSKIRYAMPAWSGFLSAHLVGLLKRAHRYGFTLDVISVEDIPESADSKLFKSITHSNHCLHFLLPPVKDQVYCLRSKSKTQLHRRSFIPCYLFRSVY